MAQATSPTTPDIVVTAALIAGTCLSILIAWRSHFWSPLTFRSPPRWDRRELVSPLLMILLSAAAAFLLVPAACMLLLRGQVPAKDDPPLTGTETVLVNTATSSAALLVLLTANLLFRQNGLARLGLTSTHFARAIAPGLL